MVLIALCQRYIWPVFERNATVRLFSDMGSHMFPCQSLLLSTIVFNDYYLTLTQQLYNTPYDWPAFLASSCLNIGHLSLHKLIRILRATHGAMHTILF